MLAGFINININIDINIFQVLGRKKCSQDNVPGQQLPLPNTQMHLKLPCDCLRVGGEGRG